MSFTIAATPSTPLAASSSHAASFPPAVSRYAASRNTAAQEIALLADQKIRVYDRYLWKVNSGHAPSTTASEEEVAQQEQSQYGGADTNAASPNQKHNNTSTTHMELATSYGFHPHPIRPPSLLGPSHTTTRSELITHIARASDTVIEKSRTVREKYEMKELKELARMMKRMRGSGSGGEGEEMKEEQQQQGKKIQRKGGGNPKDDNDFLEERITTSVRDHPYFLTTQSTDSTQHPSTSKPSTPLTTTLLSTPAYSSSLSAPHHYELSIHSQFSSAQRNTLEKCRLMEQWKMRKKEALMKEEEREEENQRPKTSPSASNHAHRHHHPPQRHHHHQPASCIQTSNLSIAERTTPASMHTFLETITSSNSSGMQNQQHVEYDLEHITSASLPVLQTSLVVPRVGASTSRAIQSAELLPVAFTTMMQQQRPKTSPAAPVTSNGMRKRSAAAGAGGEKTNLNMMKKSQDEVKSSSSDTLSLLTAPATLLDLQSRLCDPSIVPPPLTAATHHHLYFNPAAPYYMYVGNWMKTRGKIAAGSSISSSAVVVSSSSSPSSTTSPTLDLPSLHRLCTSIFEQLDRENDVCNDVVDVVKLREKLREVGVEFGLSHNSTNGTSISTTTSITSSSHHHHHHLLDPTSKITRSHFQTLLSHYLTHSVALSWDAHVTQQHVMRDEEERKRRKLREEVEEWKEKKKRDERIRKGMERKEMKRKEEKEGDEREVDQHTSPTRKPPIPATSRISASTSPSPSSPLTPSELQAIHAIRLHHTQRHNTAEARFLSLHQGEIEAAKLWKQEEEKEYEKALKKRRKKLGEGRMRALPMEVKEKLKTTNVVQTVPDVAVVSMTNGDVATTATTSPAVPVSPSKQSSSTSSTSTTLPFFLSTTAAQRSHKLSTLINSHVVEQSQDEREQQAMIDGVRERYSGRVRTTVQQQLQQGGGMRITLDTPNQLGVVTTLPSSSISSYNSTALSSPRAAQDARDRNGGGDAEYRISPVISTALGVDSTTNQQQNNNPLASPSPMHGLNRGGFQYATNVREKLAPTLYERRIGVQRSFESRSGTGMKGEKKEKEKDGSVVEKRKQSVRGKKEQRDSTSSTPHMLNRRQPFDPELTPPLRPTSSSSSTAQESSIFVRTLESVPLTEEATEEEIREYALAYYLPKEHQATAADASSTDVSTLEQQQQPPPSPSHRTSGLIITDMTHLPSSGTVSQSISTPTHASSSTPTSSNSAHNSRPTTSHAASRPHSTLKVVAAMVQTATGVIGAIASHQHHQPPPKSPTNRIASPRPPSSLLQSGGASGDEIASPSHQQRSIPPRGASRIRHKSIMHTRAPSSASVHSRHHSRSLSRASTVDVPSHAAAGDESSTGPHNRTHSRLLSLSLDYAGGMHDRTLSGLFQRVMMEGSGGTANGVGGGKGEEDELGLLDSPSSSSLLLSATPTLQPHIPVSKTPLPAMSENENEEDEEGEITATNSHEISTTTIQVVENSSSSDNISMNDASSGVTSSSTSNATSYKRLTLTLPGGGTSSTSLLSSSTTTASLTLPPPPSSSTTARYTPMSSPSSISPYASAFQFASYSSADDASFVRPYLTTPKAAVTAMSNVQSQLNLPTNVEANGTAAEDSEETVPTQEPIEQSQDAEVIPPAVEEHGIEQALIQALSSVENDADTT